MDDRSKLLTDKRNYIRTMFDSIAWRYDFLNHFLSFGIDKIWRKKAIRLIGKYKKYPVIVDIATGTADLAIAAMKINPVKIYGVDISEGMLDIGRNKIRKLGLSDKIELSVADSENLPFTDNSFDVAMVAFGIRNFTDPEKGLTEMRRVLRDDGMVLVLEFSKPRNILFKSFYEIYFRKILPFFGKIFSRNSHAYSYLPESVMSFPDNESFLEMMRRAGFRSVNQIRLTGGIASIYTGLSDIQ